MEKITKTARAKQLVSVIIPMFNEQDVIPACYQRLKRVADTSSYGFEFLFIDDGSCDNTFEIVRGIRLKDNRVKLIALSRNFGKEAAMSAGLDYASGDAVIVIDADLQDPPELIPLMLESWAQGAEIVCMRRESRKGETRLKQLLAHCYYRVLNYLSDVAIPEDVGDFRLMSRQAVNALLSMPERNRYMKGLFAWIGYTPVFINYDRDPRFAGKTKWGFFSLLKLGFEGITSFSIKPLRWMMGIGFLTSFCGFLYGVWIVGNTLLFGNPVAGYPSIIAILSFLGGLQIFSIGLLGIYVGKSYSESKQRPIYLVQEHKEIAAENIGKGAGGIRVHKAI